MAGEDINNQFHVKEFYQLQGEVKGLRESMSLQFKSLHELITANFEGINKATEKALTASDKKLDVMNEFRQSLNDYVAGLLPRKEFDGKHEEFKNENLRAHDLAKEEINDLKVWKSAVQTELKEKVSMEDIKRIQLNHRITVAIAMLGIIVAIAIAWFRH
jgi:hypothetical protein